jgi:hypothetical protein
LGFGTSIQLWKVRATSGLFSVAGVNIEIPEMGIYCTTCQPNKHTYNPWGVREGGEGWACERVSYLAGMSPYISLKIKKRHYEHHMIETHKYLITWISDDIFFYK